MIHMNRTGNGATTHDHLACLLLVLCTGNFSARNYLFTSSVLQRVTLPFFYSCSREIRDSQFLPEKLNNKAAKDSYDHFSKVEQDCSHLFSKVVQGGNLAEMSTHIKTAINSEQKKAIWVTKSTL